MLLGMLAAFLLGNMSADKSIRPHRVALYMNDKNVRCFDGLLAIKIP